MPPKNVILHFPIIRSKALVNDEPTNDDVVELSSIPPSSSLPPSSTLPPSSSVPNTHLSSAQPSSLGSHHLHDDVAAIEFDDGSPPQISDNTVTSSSKKRGRGASTGKSIEKAIEENDKKLLEIEFPEGFKKPRRFANHLANGIGVVIRHSPGLDFLTPWREIENERILPVYAGLDQWFDIKGWSTDQLVKAYMEEMFLCSYTHWRGRLSATYKEYVSLGKIQEFVARLIGSHSRSGVPCAITSTMRVLRLIKVLLRTLLTLIRRMVCLLVRKLKQHIIILQLEMERLRASTVESDSESLMYKREIIKKALGNKSGYDKGLGYGVVPSRQRKKIINEATQLKEKLNSTEEELRNASSHIASQIKLIERQEALIQTHNEEIAGLKEGHNELKEMLTAVLERYDQL